MAGNDLTLKNAKLVLQEIPVKRIILRKVSKNNKTSGKITVPEELVGKEVYIVLPK